MRENEWEVEEQRAVVPPSVRRYRNLLKATSVRSLTRALQYETLMGTAFDGKVLDIGGGEWADYRDEIKCNIYESANIDDSLNPTWIVKENGELPLHDQIYDHVLSVNTLEHTYSPFSILREAWRVTASGGAIHLWTPFLFPIHAHPDDFHRYTASWFHRALKEVGYHDVEVVPLSWGMCTTRFLCGGALGPFKRRRLQVALTLDLVFYALKKARGKEYSYAEVLSKYPLGYYARAVKP